MKTLICKLTIAVGVVLSAAVISDSAKASDSVTPNNIEVTVEAPGVQQSTLATNSSAYGAMGVSVNDFETAPLGYSNSITGYNSSIGRYDQVDIVNANLYGGASGTGKYITVQPGKDQTGSDYTTTLTLTTPERYFGLWWSAGDVNNELDFYSGGTTGKLLQKFTTADVINFVNKQSNAQAYYGNPNSQFKGQDSGEPFAFLNFFADPNTTGVTFDTIVFKNINNSTGTPTGSTGFESDNHTVASSYKTISGTIISKVPEPSAALGLAMIAGIGMLSQRRRISQQG